jgi:hypothetical protein
MHGQVHFAAQKCLLDFAGEDATSADLRQRGIAEHIAGGANDDEFDRAGSDQRAEHFGDQFGLLPRQKAAASPQTQRLHESSPAATGSAIAALLEL